MAGTNGSLSTGKATLAVIGLACNLAKNHGVELPANTAIFALGLIRLWGSCYTDT